LNDFTNMSDMKAYLAQKYVALPRLLPRAKLKIRYMSGPKADAILSRSSDPSIKKRKKKPKNEDYVSKLESGEGLKMRDEDEWKGEDGDIDMAGEGDDAPSTYLVLRIEKELIKIVIGKSLATFQKSKSTWSTVGSTSLPLSSQPQVIAGPSTGTEEEDVKPDVGNEKEKKRKGGLKTATEIRAEAEAVAAERKAALEAAATEAESGGVSSQQGQTVHRDSSGRIVDIEKLKREAKEKEDEDKRKAREREEWSKGMVQRQGREAQQREEKEMGGRDVAR
jgi:pre-mRNA-splicing factor CWC26